MPDMPPKKQPRLGLYALIIVILLTIFMLWGTDILSPQDSEEPVGIIVRMIIFVKLLTTNSIPIL